VTGAGRAKITLLSLAILGFKVPGGATYENVDYGYWVTIPTGIIADCIQPPGPNHGFVVISPALGDASVWVDASYDATYLGMLDAVVEDQLREVDRRSATITPTSLGGLQARHLAYTAADGQTVELTVATRRQRDIGVIFTVGVRCTPESCMSARTIAEELRQFMVISAQPAASSRQSASPSAR